MSIKPDEPSFCSIAMQNTLKRKHDKVSHKEARMTLPVPCFALADSYKAGHFLMYPECQKMVAYGEFREPMKGMMTNGMQDNRFVFYGMRHYVDNYISKKWTRDDLVMAEMFFSTHNSQSTPYPFPRDLFESFINENDGYFPVTIHALPEGTVAYTRTPVFMITAEHKYARLCTYLETILTMVWYPSCVATISKYTKDLITEGFEKSVDPEMHVLLDSRLHDFGFRGCTSVEQAMIGGSAHLLSFGGSDNMAACYHAQYNLNNTVPVATSIPATEHSVMTAWSDETEAIEKQIENFGDGIFSVVMDSYDYDNALDTILPSVADSVSKRGGLIVIRPDSGDPVEQVVKGLKAAEKCFPTSVNSKGYKVIQGAAVLQGDGINYENIREIQEKVMESGFSAQCVAYGMGGSLLQKVNRDTMSFATKLCYIEENDGNTRDVMKTPKSGKGKTSLPGDLFVAREGPGEPIKVYDKNDNQTKKLVSAMKIVYNNGPIASAFDDLQTIRDRVNSEWAQTPCCGNPISKGLADKIENILRDRGHS